MKKALSLIVALVIFINHGSTQSHVEVVDTTKYYQFSLNYWFNMHHLLWMEAFLNSKADSSVVNLDLPGTDKTVLDSAVRYYMEKLVEEDLRTSGYMSEFRMWITSEDSDLNNIPSQFAEHMKLLNYFNNTYKRYFWLKHKETCKKALADNIVLIRNTEEEFVDRITSLTKQFWQFDPQRVKVDLTYFGKSTTRSFSSIPYTSIFPTHVVMSVSDYEEVKGEWLELLYHESAHHLILGSTYFVAGTIRDIAEADNIERIPSQLGHAYLFFFTGKITKDLLEKQGIVYPETYMKRGGVFSSYFPLLEKHLTPYIDRKTTLVDATRKFIADYYGEK